MNNIKKIMTIVKQQLVGPKDRMMKYIFQRYAQESI